MVCSSATITFTVFPNLVANPDVISTNPSVTATGSLLTNDIGVTAGGSYAVTFNQLPGGTGTLTVNSTTGQYTFYPKILHLQELLKQLIPCAIRAFNPQQCSNTSITINVGTNPTPGNDNIATVIKHTGNRQCSEQ